MKKLISTAVAVLIILSLSACGGRHPANEVHERADMSGRAVGVLADSASRGYLERYEGTLDVRTYNTAGDMADDLLDGGIDCAVADAGTYEKMRDAVSGITKLSEPFLDAQYVLAVSAENRLMLENLNSAIAQAASSGELELIAEAWGSGGSAFAWEPGAEDRPVTVAVTADFYPYAFYGEDGELMGLEIDAVRAICAKLGLTPEFMAVEPDMLLYMAESGKTSFAVGRIEADPDNEGLSYTDSYLHSTQLIVVRK